MSHSQALWDSCSAAATHSSDSGPSMQTGKDEIEELALARQKFEEELPDVFAKAF